MTGNRFNVAIIVVLAILGLSLPLPLIGYWQLHQLKPILQTLRQTNERISFREINAGLRKTTSAKEYARNCILSGFAFGITLFNAGFSLRVAITGGGYLLSSFGARSQSFWVSRRYGRAYWPCERQANPEILSGGRSPRRVHISAPLRADARYSEMKWREPSQKIQVILARCNDVVKVVTSSHGGAGQKQKHLQPPNTRSAMAPGHPQTARNA
jgi:hypothetical protein